MQILHIDSVDPAFGAPDVLTGLLALASRVAAMGLLRGAPIKRLDDAAVKRVLDALQSGGMLGTRRIAYSNTMQSEDTRPDAIRQLIALLDESPVPRTEWPAMKAVFGEDGLADLLRTSSSSVKRYLAGERDTPAEIAERLHWLALVVAELAGSYNEIGMRRWFERTRAQLNGRSPRGVLGPDWHPSDPSAKRVRSLAANLASAGAT